MAPSREVHGPAPKNHRPFQGASHRFSRIEDSGDAFSDCGRPADPTPPRRAPSPQTSWGNMTNTIHRPAILGILCAAVLHVASATALAEQEGPRGAARDSRPVRSSVEPAGGVDPATIAKLNEELLILQHRIRDERATALRNRRSLQDRIKDLKAEERLVSRGLDALKEELGRREKEKAEKTAKRDADRAALEKLKGPSERILAAARSHLEHVKGLVERGIPWRVEERRQSIDGVLKIVSAKDASPSAALSAAGRVHGEEEALGRLVESGTVNVAVGKEEVAVEAFHLGLLAVIFANDDATILGFAQAGQRLEEGLDAASGHAGAADGYLAAVDMLRRRRTPAIIDLFIPSFPVEGGDPDTGEGAERGGRAERAVRGVGGVR